MEGFKRNFWEEFVGPRIKGFEEKNFSQGNVRIKPFLNQIKLELSGQILVNKV